MGLACCQKLLRLSAWEAFVEGKLWEAYIACGGTSMHVVVFTHTQIRGLHFGVRVQMVDLAMETQKTRFVPLSFITQVYHECETMDWFM
jgi:hypothetical protein